MDTQDLLKSKDRVTMIIKRLSYWFGGVSMVCIFVMIVFTNSDVVLRLIFMSYLPGNIVLCEILLVLSVFLGLPLTELSGGHVRMEFIFKRLPRRVQPAMVFLDRLLCLCILALLSYASISYAIFQFLQGEVTWVSATQIVLWPARFGLALGLTGFCVLMLVETIKASKFILHKESKGS